MEQLKTMATILTVFILVSMVRVLSAQQNIESKMSAIENQMSQMQHELYDLISPTNFKKAYEEFTRAKKDLKAGKDIKGILKKLENASKYLNKVNEVGTQGKILFETVLKARQDALIAQAPDYAPKIFQDSENMFFNASRRLEKGDLNGARKEAAKTEASYREAEKIAIKESIIGNVRDLLKKAEDKNVADLAPLTLTEAKSIYQEVLSALENNRYAKSNARELAAKAEYQVKHAIYLAAVLDEVRKDKKKWEVVFRNFEDRFDQIASQLGFQGHYENGLAETEKDIVLAIQNLTDENKTLKEELKELQTKNEQLSEKVQQYENTVVTELEKKKEREEKLRKIEQIFTPDEAQVLLSGNHLIIRLYGLTFRSGTAVIMPEHF
ncbi:MAG TPA: hypothetical protein ENK14_13265, partial [Caldithrix sp.]|nr:hypothetical protein [Caldithrix sp.]